MKKLIFATNNKHKFDEIRNKLKNDYELLSLPDIGFEGEIPETHETLEENAAEKAIYIYNRFHLNCFSDDTGLEIEALNGEPGVYSARYAGKNCSFEDNMNKVLEKMKGIENREARFRTVIALVENGKVLYFEGVVSGYILKERKGEMGFGYDPIFMPEGFHQSFAEMTLGEKNKISHRAVAISKLQEYLSKK
jgi:XTP/dITP diphosphohydrolase